MMEQQQALLSSFPSDVEDKRVEKEKALAAQQFVRSHKRVSGDWRSLWFDSVLTSVLCYF